MASLTHTSSLGAPLNGQSKLQDGPYQIELEDIESDETGNTTAAPTATPSAHNVTGKTNLMKPENQFVTGFTGGVGQTEAEPPSRSSTYMVRALVCAFAILLLWITSLNLSKVFVTSTIQSPETNDVVNDWDQLAGTTTLQRTNYITCSNNQVFRCNRTLTNDVSRMLRTIDLASAGNKIIITEAQTIAATCGSLTVELSQAIQKWGEKHPFETIKYNTSCTADEINKIKNWIDRPDLIHNPAYVLAGTYSQSSDARSQRMLAYAANWTAYNQQYLAQKTGINGQLMSGLGNLAGPFTGQLANITMGLQQQANKLYNCVSMDVNAAGNCPNGARAAWDSQANKVKQSYLLTKARLVSAQQQYLSVTSGMASVLSAIKSFFDNFLAPSADALGSLGIPLGSFPTTSFPIPTPTSIPTDFAWFDPSDINVNISLHFGSFGQSIAAASAASRAAASDWYSNQNATLGVLPNYFEDYNPPPLMGNMQNEVDTQLQESSDFRDQSAYALNQQAPPTDRNSTVKLVKGFLAEQANSISVTNFQFESLGGNLLIRPLLDVIPSLYLFALAIDYIWRAYRSVRLIVKYWFQSAVGLPVIDVRDYENHAGARGPVKAVTLLTHPGTVVCVIVLVAALALTAIIPPYSSILDAYVEGCVESDGGTVVTQNAFSIAYNYASSEGNKILTEGFQQYDATRNEICGQHLQKSSDDYNGDVTNLESAKTSQDENSDQVFLIAKCVDLQYNMNVSVWNSTMIGARNPLVIIAEAIDRANSADTTHPCMIPAITRFTLTQALFNCSEMIPCGITCAVERAEMQTRARDAGCNTEYLVHAFISRFWVTLLVFISLNISRMLFMAAVVRLGWRSLTPRGFEFVSNCTRVGETSKTINSQLVVQLNKAIASYERFAIFLFGLAVLVHVPYIVVLSTINQTIQYQH